MSATKQHNLWFKKKKHWTLISEWPWTGRSVARTINTRWGVVALGFWERTLETECGLPCVALEALSTGNCKKYCSQEHGASRATGRPHFPFQQTSSVSWVSPGSGWGYRGRVKTSPGAGEQFWRNIADAALQKHYVSIHLISTCGLKSPVISINQWTKITDRGVVRCMQIITKYWGMH